MAELDLNFFDDLAKYLGEGTSKEYEKITATDWYRLKFAADTFLNNWDRLQQLQRTMNNNNETTIIRTGETALAALRRAITQDSMNIDETFKTAVMAYEASRERMLAHAKYLMAAQFDKALTSFRGALPKEAVYVFTNDKGEVVSYRMSMEDLIRLTDKRGRFKSTIALSEGNLNNYFKKLEDEKMPSQHKENSQAAFQGTYNRLEQFYANRTYGKTKQGGYLMWKSGRMWAKAKISNYGSVKEAYVAALLDNIGNGSHYMCICNTPRGSLPYYDHALIGFFWSKYLARVDSAPAVLDEDVVSEGLSAQFAVKAFNAGLFQFDQYVKVAKLILSDNYLPELKNPEGLTRLIQETFPTHLLNKFEGWIEEATMGVVSTTFAAAQDISIDFFGKH